MKCKFLIVSRRMYSKSEQKHSTEGSESKRRKRVNVVLLCKKGNSESVVNYRPVSLTCTVYMLMKLKGKWMSILRKETTKMKGRMGSEGRSHTQ